VHTGVNNNGDECLTGVIDSGKSCITGINDNSEVVDHYWPASTTSAKHDLTGINDTGNACTAGVIGTGGMHSDTKLIWIYQIPNF
jgi:hypothetical protein